LDAKTVESDLQENSMLSNRINRLAPPPRPVPLQVVASAMFGFTGWFGAIFLILGLIFTLIFTQGYRPIDEVRLAASRTTAQGIVTAASETNSTENDVPVYAYKFIFTTNRGEQMTGVSYTTGERWSARDHVTIEYVPDQPSIARIKGARESDFTPWVLFVLIFPGIGAAMFGAAAIGGWRQVMLLRRGEVADAHILSTPPTGMTVNNVPVVEYSYEIRTASGETFNGSAKVLLSDQIGDEENEPALCLLSNPDNSILVDAISLRHPLDVDESTGQWVSQGAPFNAIVYILVWICAIVLGGYTLLSTIGVIR
jgi:hypothetical protein